MDVAGVGGGGGLSAGQQEGPLWRDLLKPESYAPNERILLQAGET